MASTGNVYVFAGTDPPASRAALISNSDAYGLASTSSYPNGISCPRPIPGWRILVGSFFSLGVPLKPRVQRLLKALRFY